MRYLVYAALILFAAPALGQRMPGAGGRFPDTVATLGGAATGDIDLNQTYKIVWDADGNSYTLADADDRVDTYTGGVRRVRIQDTQVLLSVPLSMSEKDIVRVDDIYPPTAMSTDAAPDIVTVIGTKHPWPGIGGTYVDGAPFCVIPASGANNLTGVTFAATTGDTLTFTTIDMNCEETITVLTEGTHYDCDGAGSDAACVVNIAAAVNGLAAALGLNAAVVVGETTNFYPTVGTVAHLTVVSSDNTNTVIVRGTDGVFKVPGGGGLDVAGATILQVLTVNGTATLAGVFTASSAYVQVNDDKEFYVGSSQDSGIGYETASTVDTMILFVGDESNSVLVTEVADKAFAWEHPQQTNPTQFWHSANQSTTEWIGITHDQTDGVISTGTGDIVLAPASGSVVFPSYTRHHDFTAGALASVGVGTPDLECCGSFCGLGLDNANELLAKAVEIPGEWDGVSDMTIHIHAVPADSDPVADTEDIDLDFEWRSVDPDTQTGKTGAAATVTSTYLQSGGAGAECEVILFSVTVPYTGGNQPLAAGDDLGIKFNRDPGSEANTYSGNIIIYKAELIYSATGIATH